MSGLHKDLAKVIYCNGLGLFLVMEKAIVISSEVDRFDFIEYIENKYKNDKYHSIMLSDITPDNFGYIGEHLVKIDYGS